MVLKSVGTKQEFLYKDLTFAINGAAMEVHQLLGPGFLESVYEEALSHEFDLRGIPYERQVKIPVRYKGSVCGEFRADFLVDGKLVVELKATSGLTGGDEAQLLNYLIPDFSPAFVAKWRSWRRMRGLRLRTPQSYSLQYVEESEGA